MLIALRKAKKKLTKAIRRHRIRELEAAADPSGRVIKKVNGSLMRLYVRSDRAKNLERKLALRREWSNRAIDERYIDVLHQVRESEQTVVALDVGANNGYYALLQAHILGPQASIVALEPELNNFAVLKANVALNGYSNIEVLHAAAGAQREMSQLLVHKSCLRNKMSSIAKSSTASQYSYRTQQVALLPLDELIIPRMSKRNSPPSSPVIIRMDIEGYEDAAFRGLQTLFGEDHSVTAHIFMEVHPREGVPVGVADCLEHSGFTLDCVSFDHGKNLRFDCSFDDIRRISQCVELMATRDM